jgi:hypothetical protein
MPLREQVVTPAPVLSLALSPDGHQGLAQLLNGRTFEVHFSPLRLGESSAPAATFVDDVPANPTPDPDATAAQEMAPKAQPTAMPQAESPATTTAPPAPRKPPAAVQKPVDSTDRAVQLRGKIIGAATDQVSWIVLYGPNNILREARRVAPNDGNWAADGLVPGRYRVQMDGGGGRVLVTRPRYLLIEIREGEPLVAPDCEILSAVQPERPS